VKAELYVEGGFNRWGRGAVDPCADYCCATVITSVAGVSPSTLPTRTSWLGGLGSWAWGSSESIPGMGRDHAAALHACPPHLVDGAYPGLADVCVVLGLSFLARAWRPGVRRQSDGGQGRLMFQHCGTECSLSYAFTCFLLSCRLLLSVGDFERALGSNGSSIYSS